MIVFFAALSTVIESALNANDLAAFVTVDFFINIVGRWININELHCVILLAPIVVRFMVFTCIDLSRRVCDFSESQICVFQLEFNLPSRLFDGKLLFDNIKD